MVGSYLIISKLRGRENRIVLNFKKKTRKLIIFGYLLYVPCLMHALIFTLTMCKCYVSSPFFWMKSEITWTRSHSFEGEKPGIN